MKESREKKQGFTLIELLSVIAVLGVLAALIIPSYKNAVSRASETKCLGNMRTLGIAYLAYVNDNDQVGPYDARDAGNLGIANWRYGSQIVLWGFLFPYLGVNGSLETPKIMICPEDFASRKFSNQFGTDTSYYFSTDVTSNSGYAPKIFTLSPQTIIFMDAYVWWNPKPWPSNHKGRGFNSFRKDGSIRWLKDKDVAKANLSPWDWTALSNL